MTDDHTIAEMRAAITNIGLQLDAMERNIRACLAQIERIELGVQQQPSVPLGAWARSTAKPDDVLPPGVTVVPLDDPRQLQPTSRGTQHRLGPISQCPACRELIAAGKTAVHPL